MDKDYPFFLLICSNKCYNIDIYGGCHGHNRKFK